MILKPFFCYILKFSSICGPQVKKFEIATFLECYVYFILLLPEWVTRELICAFFSLHFFVLAPESSGLLLKELKGQMDETCSCSLGPGCLSPFLQEEK